jgi:hypothetical protein
MVYVDAAMQLPSVSEFERRSAEDVARSEVGSVCVATVEVVPTGKVESSESAQEEEGGFIRDDSNRSQHQFFVFSLISYY